MFGRTQTVDKIMDTGGLKPKSVVLRTIAELTDN